MRCLNDSSELPPPTDALLFFSFVLRCFPFSLDNPVAFNLRPWQTRTLCRGHIVADTNVSPFAHTGNMCYGHKLCPGNKNVSDLVQKHFVSATNFSQFAQPKKHHGQQRVLVYQGLNSCGA